MSIETHRENSCPEREANVKNVQVVLVLLTKY